MIVTALLLAATTPSFVGVSLGDTPAAVIAERGDPDGIHDDGAGKVHFEYLAPSGGAIQLVLFDQGVVSAVAVVAAKIPSPIPMPAPSAAGITVGGPIPSGIDANVGKFTRPADGDDLYEFGIDPTRGVIASIALVRPLGTPTPVPVATAMTLPAVHGGTSFDDAIVVRADTDMAGTASEYFYLALHPCGGTGQWHRSQQALIHKNGKSYDQLDVDCTVGGEKRSFFFDITSTFGKH
jgi:hypothetical protein